MTSAEHTPVGKSLPRRAAAKKASKLAAEQLDSSGDEFEEGTSKTPLRRKQPQAKSIQKKKSSVTLPSKDCTPKPDVRRVSPPKTVLALASDSGSDLEELGTPSTPPGRPFRALKRRRSSSPVLQNTASIGGLHGDLSPLSSPEQSVKSAVLRNANQSPSRSIASPSRGSRMKREASHISISSTDDDPVVYDHAFKVDALVWVRLDRTGKICKNEKDTMWWPAQVVRPAPLRVKFFGAPPSSEEADPHIAEIAAPADNIILSFTTPNNSTRFHSGNYSTIVNKVTDLFSPRKRQKVSDDTLHAKWQAAFCEILEVDQAANDGFPRMVSFFLAQDSYVSSDEEQSLLDNPVAVDDDENWTPPPPGPYEIPGELVLAKESSTRTQFWPAKIIDYIPPSNRAQKPKYRVLFFDGLVRNITATMFYAEHQDGFRDCVLGEDKDNYDLDEVETDEPSGQEDIDGAPLDVRSSSPVPELPPPEDFAFTSISDQFRYVKPILIAILQQRYLPVKLRHDLFMGSAASRKKVCDTGHEKGELRGPEVEQLNTCIRRWIQRRKQRQELGLIPPDEPQGFPQEDLPEGVTNTDNSLADPPPSVASGNDIDTDVISEATGPPSSLISLSPDKHDALSAENTAQDDSPNEAITVVQEDVVPIPRKAFTSLSEIEQLTYCMNILLPEAILQLLLWRAGLRAELELQSPEEEKRLHELAEEKAQERYWVHDIVLCKRGLSKTLLGRPKPSVSQPKSKLRSGRF